MADNLRWFKVWTTLLHDKIEDDLSLEDIGRFVLLGCLIAKKGTKGKYIIKKNTLRTFLECEKLPEYFIKKFHIKITQSDNDDLTVSFKNWNKYQKDSTGYERLKRWRKKQIDNGVDNSVDNAIDNGDKTKTKTKTKTVRKEALKAQNKKEAEGLLFNKRVEKEGFLKNKEHLQKQCEILIEKFKNNGFDPLKFIMSAVKSEIPVEVYIKIIDSMVKQKDTIKNPYAWTISVLQKEKRGYYYAEALKQHFKFKS